MKEKKFKEKVIKKIREYKNTEELNVEQIKALKEHIKEIEKRKNNNFINNINEDNQDITNEYNKMKVLYENEISKNKALDNKIHYQDEQIEGLKKIKNILLKFL